MDIFTDLINETNRLIDAANQNRITLRVFGGLAIFWHSRSDPRFFKRDSPDIDFVVPHEDRHRLEPFFREAGYLPDKQFNLLNGAQRQIYYRDQAEELRVDILVGDFEMCHKIPLHDRLQIDPVTIPLTELLLSKAQIVQLNHKDALDIISLLLNNDLGDDADGKISLERIASLCAQDWGLYKTTSINLERIMELLADSGLNLTTEERTIILERIRGIQKTFAKMPKSLAWQMRDKVGTRIRWYEEVEEVNR